MEFNKILQYLALSLSGVVMIICCVIPWWIRKFKNASVYLSVASCFGSGIILGAAFTHMVPDAMESFKNYFGEEESKAAEYPWPMFICIVVLLLLISADTVANKAHHKMMGEDGHNHGDGGHQNHLVAIFQDKPEKSEKSEKCEKSAEPVKNEQHHHNHPIMSKETVVEIHAVHAVEVVQVVKSEKPEEYVSSLVNVDKADQECDKTKIDSKKSLDEIETPVKRGTKTQIIQAYIFFFALSLHSISDGLSIGSDTQSAGFYGLTIAVIAHKALDGFALGVPLYYAKLPKFHTVFAVIFCSLMTPLGIGIGIAATSSLESSSSFLAKGCVVSISMGSFIFISLWEMLPAGLNQGKWLGLKLISTFLGWGIMALIALWV